MKGRVLAPGGDAGVASGRALVLDEPLSLWGGIDPATGTIIDPHHPRRGASVAGRVLAMPGGRGSSSSSSVLAEAARAGAAPAAFLLSAVDLILAVGAAVAAELYQVHIPVVVLPPADLARLVDGEPLAVQPDGTVERGAG